MTKLPPWLLLKREGSLFQTKKLLNKHHLTTVCDAAKCPNKLECFAKKKATFLVLGKTCTRSCPFCNIAFSKTGDTLDYTEPQKIALAIKEMGLKKAIITMVTRDDLPDGGASHIARIIQELRHNPTLEIEVLTSDFQGRFESIDIILNVKPNIFAHNLETVRSLTPKVRNLASYERSLSILRYAKASNSLIKSGLLLGFGEKKNEVHESICDLHNIGCDIITIGQYLSPSKKHLPVVEYITPEQFQKYGAYATSLGIKQVFSAPFVRSSFV